MLLHQALEPSHEVAGDAVPIRLGLCDADPDDGVTPRIPLPDPVQAERGPKRPTIREGLEENGLQLHPDERELAPVQAGGRHRGSAGNADTAGSRRQSNGTERNGTHPNDATHQQTDTPTDRQTNETNRKRRRRQEHNTEGKEGKEREETTTRDERKEAKCGAAELS